MEGDDERENEKAILYMQFHPYEPVTPAALTKLAEDCDSFTRDRGYDSAPVTDEELRFPIAFSVLVHGNADQLERLLRVIHRPHNFYCVHVDANAPSDLLEAVRSMSRCHGNVFVPERLEAITYAHFSRLQADLRCMEELVGRNRRSAADRKWKYLINLTGQMFPLKTNLEMVKILTTYKGSNDIEGLSRYHTLTMRTRYTHRHEIVKGKLKGTKQAKEAPPRGISLVKGSAYGAFSRSFVEYVLRTPIVDEFLNWTRDIYSPDEFFWATVNSRWINPMFVSPGGTDLQPERKPWLAAYAAWKKTDDCRGKFVRNICVFGVGDLPSLVTRRELFANKFHANFHYLAVDCLEEWLVNKTQRPLPIDLEFYRDIRRLIEHQ